MDYNDSQSSYQAIQQCSNSIIPIQGRSDDLETTSIEALPENRGNFHATSSKHNLSDYQLAHKNFIKLDPNNSQVLSPFIVPETGLEIQEIKIQIEKRVEHLKKFYNDTYHGDSRSSCYILVKVTNLDTNGDKWTNEFANQINPFGGNNIGPNLHNDSQGTISSQSNGQSITFLANISDIIGVKSTYERLVLNLPSSDSQLSTLNFSQESGYSSQSTNPSSQDCISMGLGHVNMDTKHNVSIEVALLAPFSPESCQISTSSANNNPEINPENIETVLQIPNYEFYRYIDELREKQNENISELQNFIAQKHPKPSRDEIMASLLQLKSFLIDIVNGADIEQLQLHFSSSASKKINYSAKYGLWITKDNGLNLKTMKKLAKSHSKYLALLEDIIECFSKNIPTSIRELFYRNRLFFKSNNQLYNILNNICSTIHINRMDMKVMSSSKGFVCGDLELTLENGSMITLASERNVLIPDRIQSVATQNAKFILLVEKFTVFNQLIGLKIDKEFPVILVTGCGFPDLKTRAFLQKLWFELKLPILALMDADAFGIDIAMCYKFGTKTSAYQNYDFIVPEMRWLGLHSVDIKDFSLTGIQYSQQEKNRFSSVIDRLELLNQPSWVEETKKLQRGLKVEIDSLAKFQDGFLLKNYLNYKLCYGKWI